VRCGQVGIALDHPRIAKQPEHGAAQPYWQGPPGASESPADFQQGWKHDVEVVKADDSIALHHL
jgi:hypothetical protein